MAGASEPRVVGPGFHAKVFALVRRIPVGKVSTYGHLAALLGAPSVARHVGYALAAAGNSTAPVPWHRVVNSRGEISTHSERQRQLLEAEGVQFSVSGKIALARYAWQPKSSKAASQAGAKKRTSKPVAAKHSARQLAKKPARTR